MIKDQISRVILYPKFQEYVINFEVRSEIKLTDDINFKIKLMFCSITA